MPQGSDEHPLKEQLRQISLLQTTRQNTVIRLESFKQAEMLRRLTSIPQPREDQVSRCLSWMLRHTQDVRDLAMFSRLPTLTITRGPPCLQVSLTEAEIEPLILAICLKIKKTSPEPSNPATSDGLGVLRTHLREVLQNHCLYWNGWGPFSLEFCD